MNPEADENLPTEPARRETEMLAPDPMIDDPRLAEYFGAAFPVVERFHALLTDQGLVRGLIGPHEASRLWERHLLNSAAVAQYLPAQGRVIDVGSGAGLPGVVLAVMRPALEIVLLEPMERRADWLAEVVAELGLANVAVRRGRAEDLHAEPPVEAVTARAVAPLDRLVAWTMPLLVRGGVLVALKGRRAADEVDKAGKALRKLGAGRPEIFDATTIVGVESTTVVRIVRETVRGSAVRVRAGKSVARQQGRTT